MRRFTRADKGASYASPNAHRHRRDAPDDVVRLRSGSRWLDAARAGADARHNERSAGDGRTAARNERTPTARTSGGWHMAASRTSGDEPTAALGTNRRAAPRAFPTADDLDTRAGNLDARS